MRRFGPRLDNGYVHGFVGHPGPKPALGVGARALRIYEGKASIGPCSGGSRIEDDLRPGRLALGDVRSRPRSASTPRARIVPPSSRVRHHGAVDSPCEHAHTRPLREGGNQIHPSDPSTLYAGYAISGSPQLFVSRNGGASWTDATGSAANLKLPQLPVVDVTIDPWNPLRIFVALQWGVYVSADGGDWWRPWDEGLPSVNITEMRFRRTTRTLYVATAGRGALYRKI